MSKVHGRAVFQDIETGINRLKIAPVEHYPKLGRVDRIDHGGTPYDLNVVSIQGRGSELVLMCEAAG